MSMMTLERPGMTFSETVILTTEGTDIADALTSDENLATALPLLLPAGRMVRGASFTAGRNIQVDLSTGDIAVSGTDAGNLLEIFGLSADRETMSIDLGVVQGLTAIGIMRRALELGSQDAISIVRSSRSTVLSRSDVVAILVEAVATCGAAMRPDLSVASIMRPRQA